MGLNIDRCITFDIQELSDAADLLHKGSKLMFKPKYANALHDNVCAFHLYIS